MRKPFDDPNITRLASLLEAEASGWPVDRARIVGLASLLADRYPDIRRSMNLICERMTGRTG